MLSLLLCAIFVIAHAQSNNIFVTISNYNADSSPISFDLSLIDIDLECGGSITNVEINYDGTWISYHTVTEPNVYHFAFYSDAFSAPISARITRTLYAVNDIINATDIITHLPYGDATFDFGTNFCVEKKPYVWYSSHQLQVSYLYHAECVRADAALILCNNTHNADGVASVPTSEHWEFIKSMIENEPTGGCNKPLHVAIGAEINETLCNITQQKKLSYKYWNGDTFNASIFTWALDGDCHSQRYLHFRWDLFNVDDAGDGWRSAVICYKNTQSVSQPETTPMIWDTTTTSGALLTYTTIQMIYDNTAGTEQKTGMLLIYVFIGVVIISIVLWIICRKCKKTNEEMENNVEHLEVEVDKNRLDEDEQDHAVEGGELIPGAAIQSHEIKPKLNTDDVTKGEDIEVELGEGEFEVIGADRDVVDGQIHITCD